MRIPNLLFIIFVLFIVVANLVIYNVFISEFRGDKIYQAQIAQREDEIANKEREKLLLYYQLKDFEQSVALALPEKSKQELSQKKLADVVRVPASVPPSDLSGAKFESAKTFFKNKKYELAQKEFYEMIHQYPLSERKIEAYFMIVESQYLSKKYSECLHSINTLLELYPMHELTGFALLRLASLHEMNGRGEVALEVYKTIRTNFTHSYLQSEVEKREKQLQTKGL